MIHVIYDPYNGYACPDGLTMKMAEDYAEHNQRCPGEVHQIHTSSHLVIDALRVLVRRETIPLTQISFTFHKEADERGPERDIVIRIYPSGGMRPWPRGFCDHTETYLRELL